MIIYECQTNVRPNVNIIVFEKIRNLFIHPEILKMIDEVYSKLCRCCMKNGELDIFSTLFESQTIAKILEQIITKKVSSEDDMPKSICHECFDKIVFLFSFIKNYHKVQDILRGILKGKEILDDKQGKNQSSSVASSFIDEHSSSDDDDQPLILSCYNKQKNSKQVNALISSTNILNTYETLQNLGSYNCKLCNNNFEQKEKLETHILTCSKKIQGNISNNLTENKKNSLHSQFLNKKMKACISKHSCIDCHQSFEYIKQLEKHCKESGHIFPRRFICEVCSKKFLSSTRLNDHMRIHNNERPFRCDECDMSFTLSSNLKRHKKRHTGEKNYFCEICGKGFVQKHTLTVHMRFHNGETPYVCELCGKGYRAKPLLQQHMYKHKDTEMQAIRYQKYYLKYGKVKVECKVCQKIMTKSALYNHMKVQHGDGLKKFLCNLCGKTYATKMSLDLHINIHTKKISYNCKICSKSFTHQNYLKIHLMLHSGERPHCCDLCGKTFVQRSHLDRHKRTHTGARPYTCTYCDKTFALNENLKVHIRIHTKETPYFCSVCGKGFFNSSSRKKHEMNVHHINQK